MNYFPNATFIEWLWTVMCLIGVIASAINAIFIFTRGRRMLRTHGQNGTTKAVTLLYVQRVIRSNALGFISTLFALLGIIVIAGSNDPRHGISLLVGPIFGICIFTVGFIVAGYQVLEMAMRPQIDGAIESAIINGYASADTVEQRAISDRRAGEL